MTVRQRAQVEAESRDPVRDEARAMAIAALANHRGIIRSLTVERRREFVAMDAGPSREVGQRRPSC
jgi:hypothetical protein